jgi:hypothetical protein
MTAATPDTFETTEDTIDELPEPAGGAGLFDIDPDQRGVSQDPHVAVTGDAEALAEDLEL